MRRSLDVVRSGSPLVGIFGAIAVLALLLLLAYEFRSPSGGTPAMGGVGVPTNLPGTQPVPK
jgi:hypothetical protein